MYSLLLKCRPDEVESVSADLWEFGTAGIREVENGDEVLLISGFETNDNRAELLRTFAVRSAEWRQEAAIDWVAETHRAWPPRAIGKRLFLAPPWCREATPVGRLRIIHNPGLACGTGEHPCTQLALAALEECSLSGKTVVDVGTGSGLLAIAALRLGARLAIGVDPDVAALSAARENFALNGLPATLVAGSADCLRTAAAGVTVANISGTVLFALADDLLRITKPGGCLILTGFTSAELAAIRGLFGDGAVTSCDEWRCLLVR